MDQGGAKFDETASGASRNAHDGNIDQLCVNTLRMLSADAIEQANSGHPGLPLGAAPMAYVLWTKFLRFNPENPRWINRDRFVHSAGHGSALLYALCHLTGYDLPLDELKRFRQCGSKTPGHPEYNVDHGIECTTGPLGQGFVMGVGMAMAERFLAAHYNKPDLPLVDHYTYGIVSDGDLMEGITSEAASLAGHLKLGKLVYLYDDNHISIEGNTSITFTEDVAARFEAYGWHTFKVEDGCDLDAIEKAIREARDQTDKPSLILVRTHIGYGSPKQDQACAHGEPLGAECLKATRENLCWPAETSFHVPDEAAKECRKSVDRGKGHERTWNEILEKYRAQFPKEAQAFLDAAAGKLPTAFEDHVPVFKAEDPAVATRVASGKVLNAIAGALPNLMGGSADLAPSTKTIINGSPDFTPDNYGGRNIRFGVREHAMGAIVNGLALHGGVIPYAATFLIFSDYMKPSIRLAALMNAHSIFIFTHDSIAVGEDGPTHQPVEQLISLRAVPNFTVIRPADANETAQAWRVAVTRPKPVALILTRQNLPILDQAKYASAKNLEKGAYVLSYCDGAPDALLIATGSEVSLALKAQAALTEKGVKTRVISAPSWELFAEQPQSYKDEVLPPNVKARLGIEAGSSLGWRRWVGDHGDTISVDRFGASEPGGALLARYGFNVDNVVEKTLALIKK